ncbi:MAG: cation diffusion facilitator family transporter [Bacteroidales bacterium]|nr:cation diffusion facilitator family transporter [Bacteroidales bacterium]
MHQVKQNNTRHISLAFFLNLVFTIIEIAGGLLTNSIAIISDALHDLGDTISLAAAWYLQKVSNRGSDKKYTYGYKRFSLLGAIIISVMLLVGSVFVIRESVSRIFAPDEVNAKGMMLLAVLGIIVNGIAVLRLRKGTTLNEKAVYIHMLEDVLGWIAVLIVSIIMIFVDAPVLDPLLSIGITIWVLFNVYKNLKKTFRILLQEAPRDIDIDKLENELLKTEGILSIHDLHLWSLDGENNILTMHAVLPGDTSDSFQNVIKTKIRSTCEDFGIRHATIEFEAEGEECVFEEC